MALPDDLSLRAAGEEDLPAIAALRESVGWAAHEWALRAVLEPPSARCVVVADRDGRPLGVGSGIAYGALGWVGNMVVAEAHRRRGIGAAILEDVLSFLAEAGCTRTELYATGEGRPLYERHGFELTGPSAMARIPRAAVQTTDLGMKVVEARADELAALVTYDRPRFGGDRSVLLRMMLADPDRPVLVVRDARELRGYAWLRPDGPRIGPLVADHPDAAAAILAEAFRQAPGAEELTLNMPSANRPGMDWVRSVGAVPEPWDGRMARGPEIPRRDDTIYGNVVGALG